MPIRMPGRRTLVLLIEAFLKPTTNLKLLLPCSAFLRRRYDPFWCARGAKRPGTQARSERDARHSCITSQGRACSDVRLSQLTVDEVASTLSYFRGRCARDVAQERDMARMFCQGAQPQGPLSQQRVQAFEREHHCSVTYLGGYGMPGF